jgi:YihY family inner membrane protein
VIVRTFHGAVPGPGGSLLTGAVDQAHRNGASGRYTALVFGLVATLVTGSTVMGQMERALNRVYGVEQDRPSVEKYTRALLLTLTAGVLVTIAFTLLALGHSIGEAIHNRAVANTWDAVRWPLALLLAGATMTVLFRYSPRRHQPALSWLAFGAAVSTLLWAAVTFALAAFFSLSTSFGKTYGPLAGMVALLLWTFLAAVAVLYGAAVAAQLEAVRAGEHEPQDEQKVEDSEPDATPQRDRDGTSKRSREHADSAAR